MVGARDCMLGVLLFTACASERSEPLVDGGFDAGRDSDADPESAPGSDGGSDAGPDSARDTEPAPTPTCPDGIEPLTGTAPFARRLGVAGRLPLERAPEGDTYDFELSVDVYFPAGRVPGAEILLALAYTYPREGLLVARATIDDDGGARGLELCACAEGGAPKTILHGELLPDGGPLRIDVQAERSRFGTHVFDWIAGSLCLSPTGDVPAPSLTPWSDQRVLGPDARLWLAPSTPIVDDVSGIRAFVGDIEIPITASLDAGRVVVAPIGLFPPGRTVRLDTRALHDPLGRELTATVPEPLETTTFVAEGPFENAPAGSVDLGGTPMTGWVPGETILGHAEAMHAPPFWAVAALDPSAADVVRLRAIVGCGPVIRLISESGGSTPVSIPCVSDSWPGTGTVSTVQDVEVRRPGAGALWLSVVFDSPGDPPFAWGGGQRSYLDLREVSYPR